MTFEVSLRDRVAYRIVDAAFRWIATDKYARQIEWCITYGLRSAIRDSREHRDPPPTLTEFDRISGRAFSTLVLNRLDGLTPRLAALADRPEGDAEIALSALSRESLATLVACGVVEYVDVGGDSAGEIAVTPYGRNVIRACAEIF